MPCTATLERGDHQMPGCTRGEPTFVVEEERMFIELYRAWVPEDVGERECGVCGHAIAPRAS